MEEDCTELSTSVKMVVAFYKSEWSHSNFLVPLGHSARSNSTTLNFLAEVDSVLVTL